MRSVPSGTLSIRATTPATPTSYRSSGPGRSSSGFLDATIASIRSPPSTSLMSFTERSWPMASGVSMFGKVTVSFSGSTGRPGGSLHADLDLCRTAARLRDVDRHSGSSRPGSGSPGSRPLIGTWRVVDRCSSSGMWTRSIPSS